MKQGNAGRSGMGGGKVEPRAHTVSVKHVSEIGIHQVHTRSGPQLYEGRGLEAPKAGVTIHHTGSQSKR